VKIIIIELPKTIIERDGFGIIHFNYRKDVEIELEDAEMELSNAEKLAGGKKCLALIDLTHVKKVSKEARDLFSGEEGNRVVKRGSFCVASPVGRMIGNFFMGINKPMMPVKLFDTKDEALAWLKEFV